MKTYGYARCSTNEDKQDINRQIRELKAAGADEVIFEYEHGDAGDAKVKKNLYMLLEMAASGDTIITLEVSRLSRSTRQLCDVIDTIKQKHLRLVIVGSITIDCRNGELDAMSSAFLMMAGVFSDLELQMIRSRVRSSLQHFYKHYPDANMLNSPIRLADMLSGRVYYHSASMKKPESSVVEDSGKEIIG